MGHQPEQPLREVIAALRAVVVRRRMAESAGWVVAASVAGVWLGGWLLGFVPARPAGEGWWLVLLAAAVAAVVSLLRGRRALREDHALARLLEGAFPQLRTDLRTLLDFAARPPSEAEGEALAASLQARVEAELVAVAPLVERAAPPVRLRPPALMMAAAIALVGLSFALSPTRFAPALRRMMAGATEGPLPAAFAEPLVSTLDLVIEPPAHTGLPGQTLEGTNGDINAVAGSRVTVSGSLLVPATEVYLAVTDEAGRQEVAATVTGERFTASFAVLSSGNYRIGIGAPQDGRFDPVDRQVTVIADQAPVVAFLRPEGDQEVGATDKINLSIHATDDYGLVEVAWSWKLEGQTGAATREVLRSPEKSSDYTEEFALDLGPLALASGDVLVLQAEASDQRATGESGRGVSPEIRLRVRSDADKNEAILAEKEAIFEGLLTQLAGQLSLKMVTYAKVEGATAREARLRAVAADVAQAGRPPMLQSATKVHDAWPELLNRWDEMLVLMKDDKLTPPRERMLLAAARTRVRGDERTLHGLLDGVSLAMSEGVVADSAFAGVATGQASMIDATERAATLFDSLIASQKADALARNIQELADSRETLKSLMEKYRDTRDPKVREQIDRELRRLAKRMKELMERIRDPMEKLPQEHLNMEGLDQDKASENLEEMAGALEQMEKLLNEGKIDEALAALDRMGKEMDSLEKEMGDPLAGASSDELSELDKTMGEATKELDKVEAQQQAIAEETAKLMEEMRAETAKRMAGEIADKLARAKAEVAEAKRALDAVDDSSLRSSLKAEMEGMEASLQKVQSALDNADIRQAAEAAAEAQYAFEMAQESLSSLKQFEKGAAKKAAGEGEKAAEKGAAGMAKVASELGELMEKAESSMGSSGKAKLGELAKRQAGTEQALQGLKEKLGGLQQKFSLPEDPFAEPMAKTEGGMQDSRSELGEGAPGGARDGQQRAQEGLKSLRQQMQSMTGKQRQKQQGEGGRQVSNEKVEVPKQGETGGEAYRKRLLDAMREGGLDDYGDAIRSYYESLMQ